MLGTIFIIIHVILAIGLIALVLLQQGKGSELGSALGSGASQTLFGSQGSSSFLFKLTLTFAFLFFVNSLWLNHQVAHRVKQSDPIERLTKMMPIKKTTSTDTTVNDH
jgi:preprotein translocase subunit SecG